MRIPKTINRNGHKYIFEKIYNNVFLYKSDLGFNETFTKHDLGLLNNEKIDKKIGRRAWNHVIYVLYDNFTEEETEFDDIHLLAQKINVSYERARRSLKEHTWILNRWFIERKYV